MEAALKNAREAMSLHLYGMEQDGDPIPSPSLPENIHLRPGQIPVLIEVYMPRSGNASEIVSKKTLSIPAWLNEYAMEAGVNFSQVLQKALMQQLGLQETADSFGKA